MTLASGSFDGQVVAITGAASGMGAASATLFAELGATVAIIDIDAENAASVAARIDTAEPFVGDVGDLSLIHI